MSEPNISAWDAMMAKAAGMPEIERLRAENAAMRQIVAILSACEAAQMPTFTSGGIDGVVLYHPTVNVLWMREQARAFLGSVINNNTTNTP